MNDNCNYGEKFVQYFLFLYRSKTPFISIALKNADIPELTSIVLICVLRYPGLTQNDIAEKCALDKSVVSKKITELEEIGLVMRKVNKNNRKYYNIYITDAGTEITTKSLLIQQNFWDNLFDNANISPDELKKAAEIMKKIADSTIDNKNL